MDLFKRHLINVFYPIAISVMVCFLLFSSYAVGEKKHALGRFVIPDSDIEGFTVVRGPNYYVPGNLWNYINGAALPYLDYGVTDVMTYTGKWTPDNFEIVVDVYDMADSLGAFGIYSNERFPEYNYIEIGIEGYMTENILCFWKDRYYVKIFPQVDSPPTLAPIKTIAHTIDKLIQGKSGMSRYFSLFPGDGRLKKTEAFLEKNVLGQEYLSNAFSINYRRGEEEFQFYLIKASDVNEAVEDFKAYREFIREYGELDEKQVSIGDEAFIGKESWYGSILFVRKGIFILGSVGLSDLELAKSHLKMMISGLSLQ